MLTDMGLIRHSHFGLPGTIQGHALVYTVFAAGFLTIFFNLSRIASLEVFSVAKTQADPAILANALNAIATVFLLVAVYLSRRQKPRSDSHHQPGTSVQCAD